MKFGILRLLVVSLDTKIDFCKFNILIFFTIYVILSEAKNLNLLKLIKFATFLKMKNKFVTKKSILAFNFF